MTREDIIQCLTDPKRGETNRKLLVFCNLPNGKSFGEMENAGIKGDLFRSLIDLKKVGAIAFVDGKYFATPLALEAQKSLQ